MDPLLVLTLLVAAVAVFFAFMQIARMDRDWEERIAERERGQILEHHRLTDMSVTTGLLTGRTPMPDEWVRDWRAEHPRPKRTL